MSQKTGNKEKYILYVEIDKELNDKINEKSEKQFETKASVVRAILRGHFERQKKK